MKKIVIWIIIIVFLGGGLYYLMGYDTKNPKKNDYLESTSDFLNDGIQKIDKGIEKGKEIIEEKKKQDSLNIK